MVNTVMPAERVRKFEEETWTTLQCQDFLYRTRWPDDFVCPHCWGRKQWSLKNGRQTCAACRKQISVTAETYLHGCRIPLPKVLLAARYTVSPGGAKPNQLKDWVGLSRYETAFDLLRRFRSVMGMPVDERLGGTVAVTTAQVPAVGSAGNTVLVGCNDNARRHPHVLLQVIGMPLDESVRTAIDRRIAGSATILALQGSDPTWFDANTYDVRKVAPDDGSNEAIRCTKLAGALRAWLKDVHGGAVKAENLQAYIDEFAFHVEYPDPDEAYTELIRRLVQDRRLPIPIKGRAPSFAV